MTNETRNTHPPNSKVEIDKIQFWESDGQILNYRLFSEEAEGVAKLLSQEARGGKNKRTQIRQFYDEVLRQWEKLRQMGERPSDADQALVYGQLHLLVAKASYARGRNLVSNEFVDLMKHCVSRVRAPRDLDVFTRFFEAILAFYNRN